jgi:hypothetical protein
MGCKRNTYGFWLEGQKEKDHQESKDLREIRWDDWTYLAQDTNQWRALVPFCFQRTLYKHSYLLRLQLLLT